MADDKTVAKMPSLAMETQEIMYNTTKNEKQQTSEADLIFLVMEDKDSS